MLSHERADKTGGRTRGRGILFVSGKFFAKQKRRLERETRRAKHAAPSLHL
jgi:hypothetical protein